MKALNRHSDSSLCSELLVQYGTPFDTWKPSLQCFSQSWPIYHLSRLGIPICLGRERDTFVSPTISGEDRRLCAEHVDRRLQ